MALLTYVIGIIMRQNKEKQLFSLPKNAFAPFSNLRISLFPTHRRRWGAHAARWASGRRWWRPRPCQSQYPVDEDTIMRINLDSCTTMQSSAAKKLRSYCKPRPTLTWHSSDCGSRSMFQPDTFVLTAISTSKSMETSVSAHSTRYDAIEQFPLPVLRETYWLSIYVHVYTVGERKTISECVI